MRLLKEEDGQSIVVVAVFLGLVGLGFIGLAIDSGYLMHEKRMVQSAADAAAVAAAYEVASGNSGNEQTVANAVAKLNGFDTTLAKNPAVVTFPTPSGNFTNSSDVAVTVSKPIQTIFLGAFSSKFATQTVSATGTAGASHLSQTCVCLDGNSGQTLNMSNGAVLNANGCGVVDNSSDSFGVGISGGATLNATTLGLVSTAWTVASNVNNGATLNATAVDGVSKCAPTMPTPPTYSSCVADPGGSYGTFTFGPASAGATTCYQNLTVGANGSTCTLNPGIYVVTGELHFESGANGHSNLGGNGVFFYLPGTASMVIDNGANVNIVAGNMTEQGGGTAPSLGAYNGIAVYEATGNASTLNLQGGSTSYIGGALYAPSAPIDLANGSTMTNPIGGIVASSLSLAGGGTLNVTNDTSEGAIAYGNPKLVQ